MVKPVKITDKHLIGELLAVGGNCSKKENLGLFFACLDVATRRMCEIRKNKSKLLIFVKYL